MFGEIITLKYLLNEGLLFSSFVTFRARGLAVGERLWSAKSVTDVNDAGMRMWEHRCRYLRLVMNNCHCMDSCMLFFKKLFMSFDSILGEWLQWKFNESRAVKVRGIEKECFSSIRFW